MTPGDIFLPPARMIHVPYLSKMKDWPIEKLSTVTRSRMYIQMQPEVSWEACRKVNAFRRGIDAQPDLNSKADYAVAHSPLLHDIPSTGSISYVGKVEWNGLAPFIEGIYTLSFGHAMIEVNATEENFCLSLLRFTARRKPGSRMRKLACSRLLIGFHLATMTHP